MKKILTLCIAIIFVASYSITAQNTATATITSTVVEADTKIECQDKKTNSSKQLTGFNFNKSNKYGKSSCSSKAKSSSCCSSKTKSSSSCSSKAKSSSCCSTTKAKKCGDACVKACCTKDSDSKAMKKNAAERVRTAIANNEISPKEGEERIASLNKKTEKSKK